MKVQIPDISPLFDPRFPEAPHVALRGIRETNPCFNIPGTSLWLLTGYDACAEVLGSAAFGYDQVGRVREGYGEDALNEPAFQAMCRMMLFQNAPTHNALRSLVVRDFDRRSLPRLREAVAQVSDRLLAKLSTAGSGDLMSQYVRPLALDTLCEIMGFVGERREALLGGLAVFGRMLDPMPLSADERADINGTVEAVMVAMDGLVSARRARPQDDIVSRMVDRAEACGVGLEELTTNIMFLRDAGYETTANTLGNCLASLSRLPEVKAQLLAEGVTTSAIDEILRYDGAVLLTTRRALEDVTVCGQLIPQGHDTMVVVAAANRDPDYFPDPDRLDLNRDPGNALTFGGGAHFCLGAQLAKLELEVGLTGLFGRLPDLVLPTTVAWNQTVTIRGPQALPALWTASRTAETELAAEAPH